MKLMNYSEYELVVTIVSSGFRRAALEAGACQSGPPPPSSMIIYQRATVGIAHRSLQCMMLSALIAAVSARKTFGPSETSSAWLLSSSNSDASQPPSGPTMNAAERNSPLAADWPSARSSRFEQPGRSSHANACAPCSALTARKQASRLSEGSSSRGTLSLPHCSAASTHVARSLSTFTSRTAVLAVTSGCSVITPSSVAFSMSCVSRFGLRSAK